jgi:DNA-binding transcriptional regulator YiaG
MSNKEVREAMRKYKVTQWQLADCFGVTEVTFHKWLRHEFPAERKKECMLFIEQLSAAVGQQSEKGGKA